MSSLANPLNEPLTEFFVRPRRFERKSLQTHRKLPCLSCLQSTWWIDVAVHLLERLGSNLEKSVNSPEILLVLQVSQASGYWYQKYESAPNRDIPYANSINHRALLTSELAEIFAHAPLAPNSVAHARVREAYNKAMGKETSMVDKSDNSKKRIPGLEDECPICYETMYKVDIKKLSFCDECGNGLHNECFQQCMSRLYAAITDLLIVFFLLQGLKRPRSWLVCGVVRIGCRHLPLELPVQVLVGQPKVISTWVAYPALKLAETLVLVRLLVSGPLGDTHKP